MSDMTGDDRGAERDRVLADYEVIDAPARRELVALADLAARAAGVPYATINLLTSTHQHQVATFGFEGEVSEIEDTICRIVVEDEASLHVADTLADDRLVDNRFATGELGTIRYYGAHPLRTAAGTVIGTLCVYDDEPHPVTEAADRSLALLADRVVDLLELELASRRLTAVNERLRASNERLAYFAGQVSHDLKNPLTSVSLSLETLELDIADPDQAETLSRARRGVDRMTGLIDGLLAFAADGVVPSDDLVDLGVEAEAALDDLQARLSGACVSVGPLPVVRGDADQLRSVLMNLVDNAAKFTPSDRAAEVAVVSSRREGRHRIEVLDRGPGIPDDESEEVFAPLTRLDRTVEGSGLGLATCRRIVEAHGGTIGVEPRPGGGSVFWFELPDPESTSG